MLEIVKHIGVDFGTKRVGLALSDESGTLAFPHRVIATEGAAEAIAELARAEGAHDVVLGESLDFSGNQNPVMKYIERFREELVSFGLRVIYQPESMTSAQAARNPKGERALPASPAPQTKREPVDAAAAAIILQTYLDRNKQA